MAGERPSSSVESVRAETAWLRRLAGALTRNDAVADDVVQETWVARLAHPPRDAGPLFGWLSVVLRNVVRKRARSDSRRQGREQEAQALSEGTAPDAGTLAVRLEAQRLVSELVLALDEPYRSTVLLCYYEGFSPGEIARRQGVPAGTVRWRLKTGLDRLRGQLDQRHRGRWRGLLMPLVPEAHGWALPWKGILTMKTTTKGATLALIVLLALIGGSRIVQRDDERKEDARKEESLTLVEAGVSAQIAGARRAMGLYRPGARTSVLRFVPSADSEVVVPKLVGTRPRLDPPDDKPLRNRLEKTPANFQQMQAHVRELLVALHEKADVCLDGWSAPDPALEEGVMLGIEMDKLGLQAVWIEDMVEIPSGPLTCLSNAVYQLDWSGITEEPVTLTVRQRYVEVDGGGQPR